MHTAEPSPLWPILQQIPDPRSPQGQRHPLASVLALAVVAVMAGARSPTAIAQFGRDRGEDFARLLGFTRPRSIGATMLHYLFKRLDASVLETALQRWLAGQQADLEQICVDGKTLCGTVSKNLPERSVHLLAGFAVHHRQVLAELCVASKTNEHKAALELLKVLPIKNAVITGDAMFCQRDLSQAVIDAGGDYVWTVKANQPTLLADLKQAFSVSPHSGRLSPLSTA